MTETNEQSDKRGLLRWLLLAIGVIAIAVLATRPGTPIKRPVRPVSVALEPNAVEPAPLVFQPNVAPETAAVLNAERPDYAGPHRRGSPARRRPYA